MRRGSSAQKHKETDEEGLLRNKDGTLDMRQFGPFNVDRALTG